MNKNFCTTIDELSKKERILWLDLARTIGICLVVFCHAVGFIYSMNLDEYYGLSIQSQMFRTVAFIIGRLGVPFFLFITGSLLLSRRFENTEDIKKFYKRNLLNLLITIEIWNLIYNIYIAIPEGMFNLKDFILNVLFFKQVPLSNMWYMPMIVGIYISIPFVSIIVQRVDFSVIKIIICILAVTSFVVPNVDLILQEIFNKSLNTLLDLQFLGGCYGVYLVIGYYISKNKLKRIKTKKLIYIALLSFIATYLYQLLLINLGSDYLVWYDCFGLLITSTVMFELISRIKLDVNLFIVKIATIISKSSLAIFFIHIIIQELLIKYYSFEIVNRPISVICMFFLSFLLTIAIVAILRKNTFIRRRILFIK